ETLARKSLFATLACSARRSDSRRSALSFSTAAIRSFDTRIDSEIARRILKTANASPQKTAARMTTKAMITGFRARADGVGEWLESVAGALPCAQACEGNRRLPVRGCAPRTPGWGCR